MMKVKLSTRYDVEPHQSTWGIKCDDGTWIKTPQGHDLLLPSRALAEEIATEWRAQEKTLKPATMPLTQLSMTVLDITRKDSTRVIDELMGYLDTEMTCHRADDPAALVKRQQDLWQPLLDWLTAETGANFATGIGIMPVRQDSTTHQALRQWLETLDLWQLTGLRHATDLCGSLVVGLAIANGRLSLEETIAAAELEANFQIETWGQDPIQAECRAILRKDLTTILEWFRLLAI